VPVLIVFTKFDLFVTREQFDNTSGDITHKTPEATARAKYEGLCRSQFKKEAKDVPAVIISGNCSFVSVRRNTNLPSFMFIEKQEHRNLIEELTSTTHRFVKADSHNSAGRLISSQVQLTRPPITPAFLAWSIAQRVDHEIIILAAIEYVRSSSFLSSPHPIRQSWARS
jgi:hypothetical protein